MHVLEEEKECFKSCLTELLMVYILEAGGLSSNPQYAILRISVRILFDFPNMLPHLFKKADNCI